VGPSGRFGYDALPRYWEEPDRRFPFLIRRGEQVVGFALVTRGSPATKDPSDLDVAEFFVLRRHRRSGAGRDAAFELWDGMPGRWIVRVAVANAPALPFWRAVVQEYTGGAFEERRLPGRVSDCAVFVFRSRAEHAREAR
jgi:predicted acetyltransferase